MKRPRSLLEEIAGLDDPTPKDFDPEDISYDQQDGGESDDSAREQINNEARAHYEVVGKSKLRKGRDPVTLGPQYAGSRISRTAVDEEDEDDPFSRGFNEAEDSDRTSELDLEGAEDSGEEDEENGDLDEDDIEEEIELGSEQELAEDDDDEEDEDDNGLDGLDDILEDEDDGSMGDEDEDDSDGVIEELSMKSKKDTQRGETNGMNRSDLRRLVAEDQKAVAQTLSQSIKADAEKGLAVKKQRSNFDTLLNVRMKLQKAIIATNTLPSTDKDEAQSNEGQKAIVAAEGAALQLLDNISSLRASLDNATASKRRKISTATSMKLIWQDMVAEEADAIARRNTSLDFWSAKCRPATVTNPSRRLNAQAQQSLSDVLAGHMSDMSRLVAKTRIPRSCAPPQAVVPPTTTNDGETEEPNPHRLPIFDDADFYSSLLQQLISQRADTSQAAATVNLDGIASSEPWRAARAAKTKRLDIDTKASKGRKLRYTVHEKLQNFMAPEDRTNWSDRQCDELFGNLFGMGVGGLGESVDGDDDDMVGLLGQGEDEDGVEAGIEGLRLFAAAAA